MKTEKRRLFGTDGIRGMAGHFPLDRPSVRTVGRALGRWIAAQHGPGRVVLGEDTRESSRWIAEELVAAFAEEGIVAENAGVITTPGIAYLARTRDFSAGIVISASHNPWTDNGIKVFGHDGFKLPDAAELEIERIIFQFIEANGESGGTMTGTASDAAASHAGLHEKYVRWLAEHWQADAARPLKIIADCANGAASAIAPEVFAACGIQADVIHAAPDGKNINEGCGALHPEVVAKEVRARGADAGVTFDGDADRCLFADARGQVINGDGILLLVAQHLQSHDELPGNVVVATTMSNMGLEAALRKRGIHMLRAAVGDKYVLEEMHKSGAVLGGEQSGHIIFRDGEATTGDGLLTALRVLQIVAASGKPLHELVSGLKIFPQVIKNVRVREKKPLEQIPAVMQAIGAAEEALDGSGRVVVRYSGTEALARVMVEAESEETMQRHAESIARAIQRELGS